MTLLLTEVEARVIGCLMEKSIVTPDQYPLTLYALTHACNQKSARHPVLSLAPGEVQRAVRDLEAKQLLRTDENFKSRVEKYTQRFCNTPFSEYQFEPAQFSIICLLLLRGPQTPGELRAHSGRLHSFADNAAVVDALSGLIEREGRPLVIRLPRTPGRKDSEYMHLFFGAVDLVSGAQDAADPVSRSEDASMARTRPSEVAELTRRVVQLEQELAELKKLMRSLSPEQ